MFNANYIAHRQSYDYEAVSIIKLNARGQQSTMITARNAYRSR